MMALNVLGRIVWKGLFHCLTISLFSVVIVIIVLSLKIKIGGQE